MANEITGAIQIRVENGNLRYNKVESFAYDQANALGPNPGTVRIGVSEEAISFGDITAEGYCFMKNLDATNYIQWGPESAGSMVVVGKLKAGEIAWFRVDPSTTIRMQANTAEVDVLIQCFDD